LFVPAQKGSKEARNKCLLDLDGGFLETNIELDKDLKEFHAPVYAKLWNLRAFVAFIYQSRDFYLHFHSNRSLAA